MKRFIWKFRINALSNVLIILVSVFTLRYIKLLHFQLKFRRLKDWRPDNIVLPVMMKTQDSQWFIPTISCWICILLIWNQQFSRYLTRASTRRVCVRLSALGWPDPRSSPRRSLMRGDWFRMTRRFTVCIQSRSDYGSELGSNKIQDDICLLKNNILQNENSGSRYLDAFSRHFLLPWFKRLINYDFIPISVTG